MGQGKGAHLGSSDRWKIPIIVQVVEMPTATSHVPFTRKVRQLAQGGYRLEMIVRIGDEFDRNHFRDEVLRMLLLENILRDHRSVRAAGRTEIVPKWLFAGVKEVMQQKAGGRPSSYYDKIFSTGSILSVDEILKINPVGLDSLSLKIYQLSSAGLLYTLLDQVGGANLHA